MKYCIILVLMCLMLTTLGQNYDARISGAEILTPEVADKPKINGPRLSGARPGKPFVHRIPTTGVRPIHFEVKNLAKSLILNEETGVITGRTPDKSGDYKLQITATNKAGEDAFEFTLVVGNKLSFTPHMGWNHWYTHYQKISDSIVRSAADEMVKSGMADVGYQYVSIDDCWMRISPPVFEERLKNDAPHRKKGLSRMDQESKVGPVRDEEGNILTARDFPDMIALTDHIHAYGLKAGIYSSPGPRTDIK